MPTTSLPWLCHPSPSAGYARKLTNSFVGTELQKAALEWSDRNGAGEPLPKDCFPTQIFPTDDAPVRKAHKLPHLFSEASFWIVSEAVRSVFIQFDLGAGSLYPVEVLKSDRTTPVGGDWYCVNFGNRKNSLIVDQCVRMHDTYLFGGVKGWVPRAVTADGDIVLDRRALDGPDIWVETSLAETFFLSGPLGEALKKAKLDKSFHMVRCAVAA
jgi:hypothetical protein